ncbi:MAG: DUF1015 family protein [Syntrophales bacterium]|jgi:uncharacterized protein (DUF1015 family)|nr:DUF1015 family protein [Syntrophales bacterium]
MSNVVPFRALRPRKDIVKDVASYPYDVLNVEEGKKLTTGNPASFLHVEKPEIDLPVGTDPAGDDVHELAKSYMQRMIDRKILFQDDQPCYYIYRQSTDGHEQYGIVAGYSIEEYEKGLIKKHELTRTDKEMDRTRHIDTVGAHTGPVFLTFKARESLDKIVAGIISETPEYDFTAHDGIGHAAWVVKDKRLIEAIRNEFARIDTLYIADGHHRAAAASSVGKLRRTHNPNHQGNEEYNFFLAVAFPHNQLRILDYNRVVEDLNGLDIETFLARIAEAFIVSPDFKNKSPKARHEFGMYLDGRWYRLKAKQAIYPEEDPIGSLDVSILQNSLLEPILAIRDPRTDKRIDFVGGIRGMTELERLVDGGEFKVAFSMYPTTLDELIRVADAGLIMPPKSTWFEPKLRSGVFVHLLD